MAKGKRKDKRITLTQAQAQKWADKLYWQILRMFLAAAMDVFGWQEEQVVDFAARVNWYFDAAHTDHTITEDLVDRLLEENMGIIMEKTNNMKGVTDDGREKQGAAGEAEGDPGSPRPDREPAGEDGLHEGEAEQGQQPAA